MHVSDRGDSSLTVASGTRRARQFKMSRTLGGASEYQEHPVSACPVSDEDLSVANTGFRAAVPQGVRVVDVAGVRQAINKSAADAVGGQLIVWP